MTDDRPFATAEAFGNAIRDRVVARDYACEVVATEGRNITSFLRGDTCWYITVSAWIPGHVYLGIYRVMLPVALHGEIDPDAFAAVIGLQLEAHVEGKERIGDDESIHLPTD